MDRARGPVAHRLEATTPDGLEAITSLIHDAYVEVEGIAHDEAARTLTFPFLQEDYRAPDTTSWEPLRRTWWYEDHRVPFYAGRLTINHVKGVELPHDLAENLPTLVAIAYDAAQGSVRLDMWDKLDISVERLHVVGELTSEVRTSYRRRVYRLLGAERDTPM